jgi:multidrug efflux pump subunit AcrB
MEQFSSDSLSARAVRHFISTLVLASVGVVLGVFALSRLPIELLPSITYPRVSVRIEAPGVTPEVAVEEITRPLEEALAATDGAVQVYSQTREGQVSITLFFHAGEDVDVALTDATASVNRVLNVLPRTAEPPRISKLDPTQLPILELALTSPLLSLRELRLFADEELARELIVAPGVAAVDVAGGVREEVQVFIDLERLQATGLSITQVLDTIAANNVDVSGGRLEAQNREALVRTVGRIRSAEEIATLSFPVESLATSPAASGRRRVFIRDFARVVDGVEDQRVFVLLNGQPAVKVSILKQPDANTVDVVDAVRSRVEELRRSGRLPEGATLVATLDESVFIRRALTDVALSGLFGALLAVLVMLLFVGSLRQTFVIVLAIPLGTLFSVALLAVSGASLNVFTLGGLAVGIGAVDSSIVVLENILRGVEEQYAEADDQRTYGLPLLDTLPIAQERSTELQSALIASTTTNLAAVIPFLLIGGFTALLFNELILTVLFTVGVSLIAALTVVPTLVPRLLAIERASGIAQLKPVLWFQQRITFLTVSYGRALSWVLGHRGLTLTLVFGTLGVAAFLIAPALSTEILPRVDTGQARLVAQFPPSMPIVTSRDIMTRVDAILLRQPGVAYTFTTTGGFLFGSVTAENPLRGSSTITLQPGTDVETMVAHVNRELAALNLVDVRLRLAPEQIRGLITNNSPVRAEIDIILAGEDPQALREAGRIVLAAFDAQAQLARYRPDADPAQHEVQVRRDAARASLLGLSSQAIGQTVQTALEGTIPTQLQRRERLVDIRVQLEKEDLRSVSQLAQLPVTGGGSSGQVRLADVAVIAEGQSPTEIQRINQREVFIIAGDLDQGVSLGDALAEADRIMATLQLPPGVVRLPSASADSNRELQRALLTLSGLAVFLVFAVMAVQYNSLLDPFVILFTVPLALVGGALGLVVTGTAFGATALLGVVLLVGVIVGNGIILVERANQIREQENREHAHAIQQAAPERLRPILITTLLATLGLVPLALGIGEGTALLRPLALVVLFGLSIGTVLTLFIVPCLYIALHGPVEERAKRVKGEKRKEKKQ